MRILLLAHAPALALALAGMVWPALAALFAGHMLLLVGTLVPGSRLFGPVVTRRPDDGSTDTVWLTFDDGPDPTTTLPLLDLLDARGARATFFLVADRARAHPELVREIVQRGHQVGNHTTTHPATRFWRLGPATIRREIGDAQRLLSQWAPPPAWFRAPVGMKNPFVHPILRSQGLTLAAWTGRGLDGLDADAARILRRLEARIAPRATLVLHEGRPTTLDCTARLLGLLGNARLRCLPPAPAPPAARTR